jgi:hypothetical protein
VASHKKDFTRIEHEIAKLSKQKSLLKEEKKEMERVARELAQDKTKKDTPRKLD